MKSEEWDSLITLVKLLGGFIDSSVYKLVDGYSYLYIFYVGRYKVEITLEDFKGELVRLYGGVIDKNDIYNYSKIIDVREDFDEAIREVKGWLV